MAVEEDVECLVPVSADLKRLLEHGPYASNASKLDCYAICTVGVAVLHGEREHKESV